MSIVLWILLTLTVLLIVVIVHEFWHFIVARITGMRVDEFGVGIPPKMATITHDKKWTAYTVNWLPIGGFVRIFGESPDEDTLKEKNSFISKPLWARILVLVAGVVMNLLLATMIFATMFFVGVKPAGVFPSATTDSLLLPWVEDAIKTGLITHQWIELMPLSWSVADTAWITSGSLLISINNHVPQTHEALSHIIQNHQEVQLITLDPSGVQNEITVRPKDKKLGVYMQYKNPEFDDNIIIRTWFFEAIHLGAKETIATTEITWNFMKKVASGIFFPKNDQQRKVATEMVAGPIGMGSMFVKMIDNHITYQAIAIIIAMISVNLAVINILPFPALDGGRIVTTTLYSIFSYFPRWKQYYIRFENILNFVWFIVLMLLMLAVAWLDISRFF